MGVICNAKNEEIKLDKFELPEKNQKELLALLIFAVNANAISGVQLSVQFMDLFEKILAQVPEEYKRESSIMDINDCIKQVAGM